MSGTTADKTRANEEMQMLLARCIDELCAFSANTAVTGNGQPGELRTGARRLSQTLDYLKPFVDYAHVATAHQITDEIVSDLGIALDEATLIKWLEKSQPKIPTELISGAASLIRERRLRLIDLRNLATTKFSEGFFEEFRRDFKAAVTVALRVLPGNLSFQKIGRAVLNTSLREMQTASAALYRPSKTRTSHRFRISVRKLRSALDLFAPYLSTDLAPLAIELAPLQTCLGKLRNCDLKLNALGDWLTEHHDQVIDRNHMSPEWHAAIWLLGDLFERRPKQYRRALAAGQELLASGFASRLTRALSSELSADIDTGFPVYPSSVQSAKELRP